MLRILIEDSEGKSKLAPINPEAGDITIGRKEGNIIRLKERNVSRNHARIYNTPDGLFIEPVAARYGLKLNSTKIEGPTPLALGDEIRVGDFRLYIQDEDAADVRKEESPDTVQDIEPALQPRFVVISSNFAGVEYHVMRSKISVGRNPECDISIHHQSVSGNHAEVRRTPRGDYEIRDLNSSNGTKVNGIPITEPFKLSSGDAVTLGHVTMRYCGPGDFWSLNFGINDEPKRMNPILLIIGCLVGLILIVLLVVVVVKLTLASQQQPFSQNAQNQPAIENAAKDNDFNKALNECQANMMKGQLQSAEDACKKAQKLKPNDPEYLEKNEQLQNEKISKAALEEARVDLNDGKCRKALDDLDNVQRGTWAFNQMVDSELKNKARDCLEKTIKERALKSIENGDIADAELARDEIKELNRNSDYLKIVNEALQKVKPAKSAGNGSGSGSSRPKSSGSGSAEAAPKAPSVDTDELCAEAVKAKIKKDTCKAYDIYRKVKKVGWPNDTCKKQGELFISQHAAECNK